MLLPQLLLLLLPVRQRYPIFVAIGTRCVPALNEVQRALIGPRLQSILFVLFVLSILFALLIPLMSSVGAWDV